MVIRKYFNFILFYFEIPPGQKFSLFLKKLGTGRGSVLSRFLEIFAHVETM